MSWAEVPRQLGQKVLNHAGRTKRRSHRRPIALEKSEFIHKQREGK